MSPHLYVWLGVWADTKYRSCSAGAPSVVSLSPSRSLTLSFWCPLPRAANSSATLTRFLKRRIFSVCLFVCSFVQIHHSRLFMKCFFFYSFHLALKYILPSVYVLVCVRENASFSLRSWLSHVSQWRYYFADIIFYALSTLYCMKYRYCLLFYPQSVFEKLINRVFPALEECFALWEK